MASHSQKEAWWADYLCDTSDLASVDVMGRYPVRVQAECEPALVALEEALAKSGYSPIPTGPTGSYHCRKIGGSDTWSLHAYAIAVDIDYGNNPHLRTPIPRGFGTDPRFNLTEAQVEAVEAIVNEDGTPIWKWLGWSIGDTMHFEIDVPPGKTTPVTEAGMELNQYRAEHNVVNPPQWAEDQWEIYINADPPGSTVPESIGWPMSRFDQADLYVKYIMPLEERVADLERRLNDG